MAFGCCLHGPVTALPVCLAVMGLLTNLMVAFDCNFFQSTSKWTSSRLGAQELDFTVGAWTVQQFTQQGTGLVTVDNGEVKVVGSVTFDTGNCVLWSDHDVLSTGDQDWPITMARVTTAIVAVISIIVVCVLLLTLCISLNRSVIRTIAILLFLVGILAGLALVMPLSDFCKNADDCTLDYVPLVCLIGIGLWLLAGLSMFFVPDPKSEEPLVAKKDLDEEDDEGTTDETVEEIVDEKTGAVLLVTTTTTTYLSGNKSIIETREIKDPGRSAVSAKSAASATSLGGGDMAGGEEDDVPVEDAEMA